MTQPCSRPEARAALTNLLLRLMGEELRLWLVSGPDGDVIRDLLPGASATPLELASGAVNALDRRGALDDAFFARLESIRPRRIDEIREVQEVFADSNPGSFLSSVGDARAPAQAGSTPKPVVDRGGPAAPNRWRVVALVGTGLGVAAIVALGLRVHYSPEVPSLPAADVLGWLDGHGYTPNRGLGPFPRPGTVLQVASVSPEGLVEEAVPPLLFLPAETCAGSVLPARTSTGSALVLHPLDAASLDGLSPGIELTRARITTIAPEQLFRVELPLGNVDGALPEACVEALARPIEEGNPPTWYRFVIGTVEADTMRIDVQFEGASAADAAKQLVARFQGATTGSSTEQPITVETLEKSSDHATFRLSGRFVFGLTCRMPNPVSEGHEAIFRPSGGRCRWEG